MSLGSRKDVGDGLHLKDELNSDRRVSLGKTDEELIDSLKVALKRTLGSEPNAKDRVESFLKQKQKIYDAKQKSFQTGWGGHSENPSSFQDAMVSINMGLTKSESDRLKFAIDGSSHCLSPSHLSEASVFHTILTPDTTEEEQSSEITLENERKEGSDIEHHADATANPIFVQRIFKLIDSATITPGLQVDQQDQNDSNLDEDVVDRGIDREKSSGIQIGTIQIKVMDSIAGASYFFKISQSKFNADGKASDEQRKEKKGYKSNNQEMIGNNDDKEFSTQSSFKTIYIDGTNKSGKILSTNKSILIPMKCSEIMGNSETSSNGNTIKIQLYEKLKSEKSRSESVKSGGMGIEDEKEGEGKYLKEFAEELQITSFYLHSTSTSTSTPMLKSDILSLFQFHFHFHFYFYN